jgi:hypothetical protein
MGLNRKISFIVFIVSMITFSCTAPDVDEGEVNKLRPEINKNANLNVDPNANVAEDNEIELKSLINLPFEPVENVYREDKLGTAANNNRVPGPTDRKLTAVLKFSGEDTEKLVEQLRAKGQPFESKIDSEPWFPAELIASSQTSGDESIKGTGYPADLFYKSPYLSGTLMRVGDTDYFVLVLNTR